MSVYAAIALQVYKCSSDFGNKSSTSDGYNFLWVAMAGYWLYCESFADMTIHGTYMDLPHTLTVCIHNPHMCTKSVRFYSYSCHSCSFDQ